MPSLFNFGDFKLHSGAMSDFKIDCDALTEQDFKALAKIAWKRLPAFGSVKAIETGGTALAIEIILQTPKDYDYTKLPILIVDDVFTTGKSMAEARKLVEGTGREAIGFVIFARCHRDDVPAWITPLFCMS